MRLTYHGTAAAEGWPAIFCECDNCVRAKKAGGRNIRTRSQADVDGRLLIDFPPDTLLHTLYGKLDFADIRALIVTHSHSDHFYPEDFEMRYAGYSKVLNPELRPMRVYGNQAVVDGLSPLLERFREKDIYALNLVEAFNSYEIDRYTVTPLAANHDPSQNCLIYAISDGKRTMLYANDTGYFYEPTWQHIKQSGLRFDFVSLDTTCINLECRDGHMGLTTVAEVRDRLIAEGAASADSTRFCLHHFSHNGGPIYDELVPKAKGLGFDVSYDGMVVEF